LFLLLHGAINLVRRKLGWIDKEGAPLAPKVAQ
jgi:hypothetical protein